MSGQKPTLEVWHSVNGYYVQNDEQFVICDMRPLPEMKANARLIAAAPELLNTLKELVRCIRGGDETSGVSMDDALMDADDAIAKAQQEG